MNENILKYYEMILLWDCHRLMDKKGKFYDVYVQPDRLSPEDLFPEDSKMVSDSRSLANK